MNTTGEEAPNSPISAHCIRRWPHADQAPGVHGHCIARATEAISGAATLAQLLHSDQCIRDEREETDGSSENLAPYDANTRAGLFAALHTCLNVANDTVDRMYHMARKNVEDTP